MEIINQKRAKEIIFEKEYIKIKGNIINFDKNKTCEIFDIKDDKIEEIIAKAGTIISQREFFGTQLNIFSQKFNDIKNIKNKGTITTLLLFVS